jgi:hypothetical protein
MATIDWTDENPGLLLREGDDGPATTLASLFRVVRSPYGYGHATFLLRNPQTPGTGNPELAAWLKEHFLRHFEPYRGLPALESLAMIPAEFAFTAESRDPWIETVRAGDAEILVNGEKLPGKPMPRSVGGRDITSAFLAFSETWIRD